MPRPDPTPRTKPRGGWLIDSLRRSSRQPRKPLEGGEPIPAVPPRGPVPLAGGAEAPLE